MTKFVDFNVFSRNFFEHPLPGILDIEKGEEVNPVDYPVLEDYIPEDKLM